MKLTSPAYEDRGHIPDHFTCTGDDVNPELYIDGIPEGTKGLVLMLTDIDSIEGTWLHWLVYDIPVTRHIKEDSIPGKQGMNTFEKTDYGGPCPRIGEHRYVFTVYALDMMLGLPEGAARRTVDAAMAGHVLAVAELIGLYQKPPAPVRYREIRI